MILDETLEGSELNDGVANGIYSERLPSGLTEIVNENTSRQGMCLITLTGFSLPVFGGSVVQSLGAKGQSSSSDTSLSENEWAQAM